MNQTLIAWFWVAVGIGYVFLGFINWTFGKSMKIIPLLPEAKAAAVAYEKAREEGDQKKAIESFWKYFDILSLSIPLPIWIPLHKKSVPDSYKGTTESFKDRLNRWIIYAGALSFFFAAAISFLQAFMTSAGWL
ncbi:MAG: hypothetical protein ACXV5N_13605 [Halobacteriota archaeon]